MAKTFTLYLFKRKKALVWLSAEEVDELTHGKLESLHAQGYPDNCEEPDEDSDDDEELQDFISVKYDRESPPHHPYFLIGWADGSKSRESIASLSISPGGKFRLTAAWCVLHKLQQRVKFNGIERCKAHRSCVSCSLQEPVKYTVDNGAIGSVECVLGALLNTEAPTLAERLDRITLTNSVGNWHTPSGTVDMRRICEHLRKDQRYLQVVKRNNVVHMHRMKEWLVAQPVGLFVIIVGNKHHTTMRHAVTIDCSKRQIINSEGEGNRYELSEAGFAAANIAAIFCCHEIVIKL
jgi:hypothetical protein